jgi:hypothetical protein
MRPQLPTQLLNGAVARSARHEPLLSARLSWEIANRETRASDMP